MKKGYEMQHEVLPNRPVMTRNWYVLSIAASSFRIAVSVALCTHETLPCVAESSLRSAVSLLRGGGIVFIG